MIYVIQYPSGKFGIAGLAQVAEELTVEKINSQGLKYRASRVWETAADAVKAIKETGVSETNIYLCNVR